MKTRGYLEGSHMANAFNMLRPNDLIWPYVVNVYLKGQAPFPFDLLYWNSDSTRMPAANHAFYLRNCYLENKLAKGEMEIGGVKLDLKKVKIPIFNLATREDHIAPARSVFLGSKAFGGPVDFVLAGSGHIAGVVNPVGKAEIPVLDRRSRRGRARGLDRRGAPEHPGHLVAVLVLLDREAGAQARPRARARRRQARRSRRARTYVRSERSRASRQLTPRRRMLQRRRDVVQGAANSGVSKARLRNEKGRREAGLSSRELGDPISSCGRSAPGSATAGLSQRYLTAAEMMSTLTHPRRPPARQPGSGRSGCPARC